jgi:hypothetical protein
MKILLQLAGIIMLSVLFNDFTFAQRTVGSRANQAHDPISKEAAAGWAGAYTFSTTTAAYTDLVGSTSISNGIKWDIAEFEITLPFPFRFYSKLMDKIIVSDPDKFRFSDTNYYLCVYEADMIDRGWYESSSKSPISYIVTGNTGSRIMKIEWKNCAFWDLVDSSYFNVDYINLQLWLFEGSNALEIHIGPNNIPHGNLVYNPNTGPYIGLEKNNQPIDYYSLNGSPSSPVMLNNFLGRITGTPPSGTVYRFSNTYVGIEDDPLNQLLIYPNPFKDRLIIHQEHPTAGGICIRLMDIAGKIVYECKHTENDIEINNLDTPPGVYLLSIDTGDKVYIQKLIRE